MSQESGCLVQPAGRGWAGGGVVLTWQELVGACRERVQQVVRSALGRTKGTWEVPGC